MAVSQGMDSGPSIKMVLVFDTRDTLNAFLNSARSLKVVQQLRPAPRVRCMDGCSRISGIIYTQQDR
jgi:hypothetical protein